MPQLQYIKLTQFKNYDFARFDFTQRVVGICGQNGKGKTNLLDAIYYTCFTKSYFGKTDAAHVQFGANGFRIESHFDEHEVVLIYRGASKKELLLDAVPIEKFSAHIGQYPAVMVAPDDVELITGGSEERRKFTDTLLSQLDAEYLQQLIRYNKILQQRNSLLKSFADGAAVNWPLLEVLNEQLAAPAQYIFQQRLHWLGLLLPAAAKHYQQIAAHTGETVLLQYESQLHTQSLSAWLQQYQQRDLALQRTGAGIHKDEVVLQLNKQPFKSTASQGQRKSLLFALKLAEYDLLAQCKGFAPLLLLDDVFEKLDAARMQQLLKLVCHSNGQVFITDTHQQRLADAFTEMNITGQMIVLP
jgi:DNA replication and repair protein RecF